MRGYNIRISFLWFM